jgi:hypothetical protein
LRVGFRFELLLTRHMLTWQEGNDLALLASNKLVLNLQRHFLQPIKVQVDMVTTSHYNKCHLSYCASFLATWGGNT